MADSIRRGCDPKSFTVLSREQKIHRHYFLEASAGTGKTFAIEHIAVRLLVEDDPLPIEQILIVTFTKAATRDLLIRIRTTIEQAIACLSGIGESDCPDYLLHILEKGDKAVKQSIRRLEKALFCFDQAQIFTIHSFCARLLTENIFEGNVSLDAINPDRPLSHSTLVRIIHDCFRTKITPDRYSEGQLRAVLKEHQGERENLERALLHAAAKGIDIEPPPSLTTQLATLQAIMASLKKDHGLCSESILQDIASRAGSYSGFRNRQRQIKPEVMERINHCARLFDKEEWTVEDLDWLIDDQLFIMKAAVPDDAALENLSALVHPIVPFARMAYDCQQLMKQHLDQEEALGFDDILRTTQKALDNRQFLDNVRKRYRAVIVDEFQDTDPLQWDIFSRLFPPSDSSWGHLYLVGDPKQSIYAFRQADLYTYLSAADHMEGGHRASLDVNYRSHPALVQALNGLFQDFFSSLALPREKTAIPYRNVKSPPHLPVKELGDGKDPIHFFVATDNQAARFPLAELEKRQFFPFIIQEISRLHKDEGVAYDACAILVSDRYQGARVAECLRQAGIPANIQRKESLADSPARTALRDVLAATLHPHHESSLKTALGGKIIQWTCRQVRDLIGLQTEPLRQFHALKHVLLTAGIAPFFQALLESCWHEDALTVAECLLSAEDGIEFFSDLQHIIDILIARHPQPFASPESLLSFLDEDIKRLSLNEDSMTRKMSNVSEAGVHILTIHASKGLEYPIVFALGLVKRTQPPPLLIPCLKEGRRVLAATPRTQSLLYQEHCKEVDAEKMRQLYVAMTRAKIRLYNPVAVVPKVKQGPLGCASPMELFLNNLPGITNGSVDPALALKRKGVAVTALEEKPEPARKPPPPLFINLVPPPTVKIPGAEMFVHSFTSLSQRVRLFRDRLDPPNDFTSAVKTAHTLPAGSETGVLLHKCLECLPLSIAKTIHDPAELSSHLAPFLMDTELMEWSDVVCEIVYNALKTPLTSQDFCLADLHPDRCLRETEFLYPTEEEATPGYLKGVIDLFCEHRGIYYLIDWKSNRLGPADSDYHPKQLERAMHEHRYFLQAKIYVDAIKRYLRLVDGRPFTEIFGGVYYVFLRGVNRAYGNQYGIYKAKTQPTPAS
ncbi:MAG: UvrD-helicase domain-containing protein [Waddliaceae bacterium]